MGDNNGSSSVGNNRVTVSIFGQDYTIAGNASQKQMTEVAAYVNKMMTDLNKSHQKLTTVSLAVLTAVNTASDLYESQELVQEQEKIIENLQSKQAGLENLWENAKQSLKKYKDDTDSSVEELNNLRNAFKEKNAEIEDLKARLEEMSVMCGQTAQTEGISEEASQEIDALEEQLREAKAEAYAYRQELNELKKNAASEGPGSEDSREAISLAVMQEKYKEMENSFFDIQMENINLKNQLDELNKK